MTDIESAPRGGFPLVRSRFTEVSNLAFQFIYYRYYNYELDAPFLPQFLANLDKLKRLTGGQQQ